MNQSRIEWCALYVCSGGVYGITCVTALNVLLDYEENISFSFCDDCLRKKKKRKTNKREEKKKRLHGSLKANGLIN